MLRTKQCKECGENLFFCAFYRDEQGIIEEHLCLNENCELINTSQRFIELAALHLNPDRQQQRVEV